ncbi:hypothetical protein HDV00_002246 [Rhizophlyctis rosea]|nr:hypothetical protein HDV00_002246 [Rhizophlyctis rosea]
MATIYSLPLPLLMNILDLVKLAAPARRRRNIGVDFYLAQVCKTWRIATFKLNPGDALNPFLYHGEYKLGLDPLRVQLLRSICISAGACQRVFPKIDITNLQEVHLSGTGSWHRYSGGGKTLEYITTAFANAEKPLRLKTFSFDVGNLGDATSRRALQALLDTFQGAPLEDLTLEGGRDDDIHKQDLNTRHHFCLNATYNALTSLHLSESIAFDDLSSAAPNLESLSLHGSAWGDQSAVCYPMQSLILPKLRKINYDGDAWGNGILTLPLSTISVIKELELNMHNTENLVSYITIILARAQSLERFTLTFYQMYKEGYGDLPTIQTLSQILQTTSPTLRRLTIPVEDYDPDTVIAMLLNKPSLQEVELFTRAKMARYEVAKVCELTGVDFVLSDMMEEEVVDEVDSEEPGQWEESDDDGLDGMEDGGDDEIEDSDSDLEDSDGDED